MKSGNILPLEEAGLFCFLLFAAYVYADDSGKKSQVCGGGNVLVKFCMSESVAPASRRFFFAQKKSIQEHSYLS